MLISKSEKSFWERGSGLFPSGERMGRGEVGFSSAESGRGVGEWAFGGGFWVL
jgi:hypothetical protein